jgi:uncharacterized protein (DUF488 family)
MKIYTIGHSTRSLEEFIDVLKNFHIELVIDIRRFPSSKKFPHFNKENLEKELEKNKIQYLHFPELGGYRKEGYETFTKTEQFENAVKKLLEMINDKAVALLCSEILWWRCHRRYVANELVKLGYAVTHILTKEKIQEHKLREKEIEEKMKVKIFCDEKAKKFA